MTRDARRPSWTPPPRTAGTTGTTPMEKTRRRGVRPTRRANRADLHGAVPGAPRTGRADSRVFQDPTSTGCCHDLNPQGGLGGWRVCPEIEILLNVERSHIINRDQHSHSLPKIKVYERCRINARRLSLRLLIDEAHAFTSKRLMQSRHRDALRPKAPIAPRASTRILTSVGRIRYVVHIHHK